MAIATLDDLIAALGSGPQVRGFYKTLTPIQSAWVSLFGVTGFPGAAVNPSSGVAGDVPTDATAGAFPFTNPTAPDLTYLARLALTGTQSGVLAVYDRLWQNSGLSATLLTAQTVNSVALTRPDANGADAEAWMQIYATMGAGANAPTMSYTDQDGNAGNTGTVQGYSASAVANRTFPIALASGDTGVRSIQSWTNSVSMTSGTFGIVIRRRLATLVLTVSNIGVMLDPLSGGLPIIPDDACLELLWLCTSASAVNLQGNLQLAQG